MIVRSRIVAPNSSQAEARDRACPAQAIESSAAPASSSPADRATSGRPVRTSTAAPAVGSDSLT